MTGPLVVGLLALVVVCGVAIATLRSLFGVLVVFAAYSLGLAMLWLVFRAPDVALTEAAVGAGVTTALVLVTAVRVGASSTGDESSVGVRPRAILATVALVAALGVTVPSLPGVGVAASAGPPGTSQFYLQNAPALGVDNVVTAILVAYRGFDTLGEVVVVFAAGLAAVLVLQAGPGGDAGS